MWRRCHYRRRESECAASRLDVPLTARKLPLVHGTIAMPTTHPVEHLRLILRQVPGAIWATDTELRLTYVHGQAPMLDLDSSTRLVGTTIYDFVRTHDPTEPVVAHHLAALSGGRESFAYERRGRWFDVQIEPLRDDHKAIVG